MQQRYLNWLCGLIIFCSAVTVMAISYMNSTDFMTQTGDRVEKLVSENLETEVTVGSIRVQSWHSVVIEDINIVDKQQEQLAQVKEATVNFSLWSMVTNSPLEGIDTITLKGPEVNLWQRADGSWNYQDLLSDTSSGNEFYGKIIIEDGVLHTKYNKQNIDLENIQGSVDLAHYPSVTLKGTCTNQGASAEFSATIGDNRQTFDLQLAEVSLENYLTLLPQDTLNPEMIHSIQGKVSQLQLSGARTGEQLTYKGEARLQQGSLVVMDTPVEDIQGLVLFDEKLIRVFASAQAQGQQASAHGTIQLTSGTPVLNLAVSSQAFDPQAIFHNSPYQGPIAFVAQVTGAADDPVVLAQARIAAGQVAGVAVEQITANIDYHDNTLTARDIQGGVFGGSVQGEVVVATDTLDCFANLHLQGLQGGDLAALMPETAVPTGQISGDIALSGNANNLADIAVWGDLQAQNVSYQGLELQNVDASFAKNGSEIQLDYFNSTLANGGKLGIEGKVNLGDTLDLTFYGSDVDMSLVQVIRPEADITGLLDITGTVVGPIDNPIVRASFAARDGSIYQQPFDRLHGSAGGSLRGVKINNVEIESGEKTKWYVNGMVGFLGDMGINLRVDTVAARMEDVIKAIDPTQQLTGNVDNVITITGTLKNPNVVGYIHFYQGSYNGVYITGMDGDYTVKDKKVTLQDFHIFTPWVDVDLNGTIDPQQNLKMHAKVHEVDLTRYTKDLPVPLAGLGHFEGNLTGTINSPHFEGQLDAENLQINGQSFSKAAGVITYQDHRLYAENFILNQGKGVYKFDGHTNLWTRTIRGKLDVSQGDVHSLAEMLNWQDNKVQGTLDGSIVIAGTIDTPEVQVNGFITDGAMGEYALDKVVLNGSMSGQRIVVEEISGHEGAQGFFEVKGTADLQGGLNLQAKLHNIDVGALTGSAGLQTPVSGLLDSEFQITGTPENPQAQIPVTIRQFNFDGTRLDDLTGQFSLNHQIINIESLVASKNINKKTYQLTAKGKVPIEALSATQVTEDNQFDVLFTLDDADLSLLPAVSKYIDWALGATDGKVRLQGIAKRPYLSGSVNVTDGAVKFKDLVNPITNMEMRLLFMDNTMTLEKLQGNMGNGNFTTMGFVHFDGLTPDDYNLDINMNKLDVDCSFFRGPLTATLQVEDHSIVNPLDDSVQYMPKVSGQLFLENDIISTPTLPDSTGDMPLVALDYDVQLGKHVKFLSSQLANLDLAGEAHFGGTTRDPKTSGSIYVKKGTLSYLKTNFKILEGAIVFGQPGTLFPKVVLKASTNINKIRVYLSLDGPVDKLKFRLKSTPQMSEADIIQLLTLRSDYFSNKNDGSKLTSMVNIGLQMALLAEVETAMRNALNLDLFTVERDTEERTGEKTSDKSTHEVYNVIMGKNITDKLMLKVSKSMSDGDYKYGFDYELSEHISLTVLRNQDNDFITGVEARFSF